MNSITEKAIDEQVELRLRFQVETTLTQKQVVEALQTSVIDTYFQLKVSDDYCWVSFKKKYQKIYTPQLQLRHEENEENTKQLHFLFGPDSDLWTMFMFLHFGLAICFIGLSIWLYTHISLQKPYEMVVVFLGFIAFTWIGLYFWARNNRKKGKPQAKQLEAFVIDALEISKL